MQAMQYLFKFLSLSLSLSLHGLTVLVAYGSSSLRLRDHTHSDTLHSVGLFWMSEGLLLGQKHNTHNRQVSMLMAGFEPANPASEWPQTHDLDRAATGIGFH
jgi:hypothetical protein